MWTEDNTYPKGDANQIYWERREGIWVGGEGGVRNGLLSSW